MQVITYIHKGKVQNITIDELRKLKIELSHQWENTCQNCGKCCFDKVLNPNGVLVIDYNKPCQHLKFMGRRSQCDVYEDRFNKSACYTIPEAIHKRCLPADCPYVKSQPGYKAPVDNGLWYKKARNKLAARYNYEFNAAGGSPVSAAPVGGSAQLPPRITSIEAQNLTREDLGKPKDWKRRKKEQERRAAGGPQGILDPREKTKYNIKPSGHSSEYVTL